MLTYEMPSSLDDPIVSGEVKNPYTLYRGLIDSGHAVKVVNVPFLTHTARNPTVRTGTAHDIVDLPDGRGRGVVRYYDRAKQVSKFLRSLNPGDIDVVHAQAPVLALGVSKASESWSNLPLAVTGHGTNLPEANADAHANIRQRLRAANARLVVPIDRAGFRAADSVISVSRFQAKEMIEIYGVPSSAVSIIHNGIELSRYARPTESDPTSDRILFVGRLAPKKGVTQLVEAMPLILATRPHATLTIVGGSAEFDFIGHEVIERIRTLHLEHCVRIEMAVPETELPKFYHSHDVLVAPSEGYESLPTVILEAMAAECPVIATQSWGTPEALGEQHPGLLDDNDPQSIASAVVRVLGDPLIRQHCLSEQRARIDEFDSRGYVSKHVDLYSRLIEGNR